MDPLIKVIEKPHTVLLPELWLLSCNKKFQNSMISRELELPKNIKIDKLTYSKS